MDDPVATDDAPDRFAQYVVPELGVLLRVARGLVSRPVDGEDLVQDALIRAYRSIDTFDGAHPRAWLLTILRNTNRNRNRRRSECLLGDGALMTDVLAPPSATPEHTVVEAVFDDAVEDALSSLSEDHRAVVELVDVEGLSYAEAAEALSVPVGTIMSRLSRARAKIRERLLAGGLFGPGERS